MKNKKSLKIGTSIEKNMTSETIISEKMDKGTMSIQLFKLIPLNKKNLLF